MGTVGERIKNLRIMNHLTQDDVAQHLGVGKQAIYKYETGAVTNIPLDNISKMAKLFGVPPEYIAGWSDQLHYGENSDVIDTELNAVERELVFLYRMADDRARSDAVDTLRKHQIKDTENKAI